MAVLPLPYPSWRRVGESSPFDPPCAPKRPPSAHRKGYPGEPILRPEPCQKAAQFISSMSFLARTAGHLGAICHGRNGAAASRSASTTKPIRTTFGAPRVVIDVVRNNLENVASALQTVSLISLRQSGHVKRRIWESHPSGTALTPVKFIWAPQRQVGNWVSRGSGKYSTTGMTHPSPHPGAATLRWRKFPPGLPRISISLPSIKLSFTAEFKTGHLGSNKPVPVLCNGGQLRIGSAPLGHFPHGTGTTSKLVEFPHEGTRVMSSFLELLQEAERRHRAECELWRHICYETQTVTFLSPRRGVSRIAESVSPWSLRNRNCVTRSFMSRGEIKRATLEFQKRPTGVERWPVQRSEPSTARRSRPRAFSPGGR